MAAFQTTPWRLISWILGIMCISLLATLGILLKNLFTKPSIEPTISPRLNTERQQGSDCCSCQERWIGYQCNCYFISNELKTWADSKDFCISKNSSLLQIQNEDELQRFMKYSKNFYWIGLSYSEEHHTWLWENGSAVSPNLFPFPQTANPKNCIAYSPSNSILDEDCQGENRYICKQQLT
uniref:Natural killer cells antigen CD94 n=1 Tax=Equus caballus TaxID=9796 RepID=A0A5F5PSW3_HORSE|nr:natural killer cells antigen CD94 isoform X1 [Equus caballus]XP_023497966.1 natural killer cells antigen CD94 isoform X1 [Equus caballus]